MIYIELTQSQFADYLSEDFNTYAAYAIFDFFEELGEDYSLDIPALRGTFTEYESLTELFNDWCSYLAEYLPEEDEDEAEEREKNEEDREIEDGEIESALDDSGAWYRILDDGSVLLDTDSL